MKQKSFLIFFLVFALILAACQAEAPAPEATEAPVDSEEVVEAYPAAGQENLTAEQPAEQAGEAPAVLYPDPQDGAAVEWSQAAAMILNEEVVSIVQSADLKVFLTLKDGRTLSAVMLNSGALQTALDQCGAACESIEVTTE